MIAEGIRMKVAIVFIVMLVALLPALPFVMEGDGALRGRIQAFLSYSLGTVSVILSLLTLFLACRSLSAEIRTKQIQTIATKPIPRWQIIVGKWLGIAVLNAVLLAGSGGFIYAAVRLYLQNGPEAHPGDRDRLHREVLTARHGRPALTPDEEITSWVNAAFEDMREKDELGNRTPEQVKRTLRRERLSQWRAIEPLRFRTYRFDELQFVDRSPGAKLYIRYKPMTRPRPPREILLSYWEVGDPRNAKLERYLQADQVDVTHEFAVPTHVVSPDGTLTIVFWNMDWRSKDPQISRAATFPTTVRFEDGIEVLYRVGSFEGNFIRTLGIMYCRLIFLGALGLFAASFLSFPVAVMLCLLVFVGAIGAGFFTEALETTGAVRDDLDPFGIIAPIFRPIAWGFLKAVPDFSYNNAVPILVDGRVVTLLRLLYAIGVVAIAKSAIVGALACVIFHRRELAEVVV